MRPPPAPERARAPAQAARLWGRDDRLPPVAQTQILKAKLASCRVVVFDNCGHLPQIEKADAFNTTVLEFLRGVP